MDWYSNFPGPCKKEAIKQVQTYLEPILMAECKYLADVEKNEELKKLIIESICTSVEQIYDNGDTCPGSATGWAVFVRNEVIRNARTIFKNRIDQLNT